METLNCHYFLEGASFSPDVCKSDDCQSLVSTGSSNESDDCRKSDCISNGNGKDSGVECLDEIPTIDPLLMKKLAETVEYYFSDENLNNDTFLRKHIHRNKEGYVSLKLISSFRKVKALTKNWEVVAMSVKNVSNKLQINESLTKVRRIKPFTCKSSQEDLTIITYGFRDDQLNKGELMTLFSSCGKVCSMNILKPTDDEPNWLQVIPSKFKEMKNKCLVIVEFEDKASVKKTKEELSGNRDGNWRKTLKVITMSEISNTKPGNRNPSKHYIKNIDTGSSEGETVEDKKQNRRKSKKDKLPDNKQEYCDSCYNSGSETDLRSNLRARNRSFTTWSVRQNQVKNNPSGLPYSRRQKSKSLSDSDSNNSNLKKSASFASNIIRMPLGPDGSKGFKNLTKLRSNSEPVPMTSL